MTISEFKAWFDGFTESMGETDTPTLEQWQRIKEKLQEVAARAPFTFPWTAPVPAIIPTPFTPTYPTWEPNSWEWISYDSDRTGILTCPTISNAS